MTYQRYVAVCRYCRRLCRSGVLLLLTLPAGAQKVEGLTDAQVQQFVQQAQASGLTDAQIEQLAQQRGFTTADITKMRQRIEQVKAKPAAASASGEATRQQNGEAGSPPPALPTAVGPPVLTTPVFGAALFNNTNLTFEPNLRLPTPKNYQIGPEDELVVDVFGNAQQTYRAKVSPEGTIRIENLSPIYVNGLTVEQAEHRVLARLRTLFAGLNSPASGIYAQVTLGSIRTIRVTLIGQVARPGTYALSSLATVFNALYAAGGPSVERGSFRDVRLYRNNRLVRQLDVYDFLLRADQKDNVRVQDQDIVFVDHAKTRVELAGEVNVPGLYEVRPGETLRHIVAFAGGYTDRAYTAAINVRRNTDKDQELLTIAAADVATFVPRAGDRYVVGGLLDRFQNKVSIGGAVFRPGDYDLRRSPTLRQLIRAAEGLREDVFLNRATVRRLRDNLDPEIIAVDLGKLMRNEVPDLPLRRNDQVSILSINDLRERRTVTVQGAVIKGGTFDYADSLTVADVVILAGGFTEAAIASRIEIARRVKGDTAGLPANQNVRLLTLAIDENLRLAEADARLPLRPYDVVYVRQSPRYEAQKGASVAGEVYYPGAYAIRDRAERITELIARAGGLKPDAFLPSATFVRKGETVAVDLRKILDDPGAHGNLLLEEGDQLTIPRRPQLVRVKGEVLNPNTVEYNPAYSFRDYINNAGGFSRKAQRKRAYAVYANGLTQPTRSFLGMRTYPRPQPGMEITVPAAPPPTESRLTPVERVTILTSLVSMTAVLISAIRPLL